MTDRERIEYLEKRMLVLNRAHGKCENCGNKIVFDTYHMSHKIGKGKTNIKKYGRAVIHHPLNIMAMCCDECNRKASIGAHTQEIEDLVSKIKKAIAGEYNANK